MNGPAPSVQKAVVAVGLADAGVKAIVFKTPAGPAVFASGQPFDQVFPRTVIETPQIVPARETRIDEVFVTLHHFATGANCTLVAGDLADAWRAAFVAVALVVPGFVVAGQTFEGSHPVGDPDPSVEHVVSTFRFLVGPTA